jgi:hypothetical protein
MKQTTRITITISHDKPLKDITDLVSGRVYTLDGVTDVTATLEPESFDELIQRFNKMYRLECPRGPSTRGARADLINILKLFRDILEEELSECDDIIKLIEAPGNTPLAILTEIADWLGDIMVYCASELAKYGLRSEDVLRIIMASNFSKLGADGKPIYDERGKVLKGPNYWKPEPMIQRLIQAQSRQAITAAPSEPHGY